MLLVPRVVQLLRGRLLLPGDYGRLLPEQGQLVLHRIVGDVALLRELIDLGVHILDVVLQLVQIVLAQGRLVRHPVNWRWFLNISLC